MILEILQYATALLVIALTAALFYVAKRLTQILYHENLQKSRIGTLNEHSPNKNSTAIVIGGSLGGLISAATLSHHFKKVIVLEQQEYLDDRSNAPQRHFIHSLLYRGRSILDKIFPGFSQGMIDRGTMHVDYSEFNAVTPFGSMPQFKRGEFNLTLLSFSRDLLELYIRERVASIKNVEVRTRVTVKELLMDDSDKHRVVGVKTGSGSESSDEESLFGSFVVDCSGRSTKTLSQLIGHFHPGRKISDFQSVVRSNVVYSSSQFKIKKDTPLAVQNGINQHYVLFRGAYPSVKTVGVNAIEDGKAILSLIGVNNPKMPKTVYEARTSYGGPEDHPILQKVTNQILDAFECNDEDELKIYKKEGSTYQHFEKFNMKGYVALGDVVCSLSPIYGQGMTLVSEQCLILDTLLRQCSLPVEQEANFGPSFQQKVYDAVTLPWTTIAIGDLKYPGTTGGNVILQKTLYPVLSNLLMRWAKRCAVDKYMWEEQIRFQHMDQNYKTRFLNPVFLKKVLFD